MKRIISVILALAFAISLCACGSAAPTENKKYTVVCMDFPSYDFARAVGGDSAAVVMAIPSDADAHSWTLTLSETAIIQTADLLVYVGGEGDEGVEKAVSSSPRKPLTQKLTSIIPPVIEEIGEGMVEEEEEGGEPEYDVHVWTSPVNAKKICLSLCETLCREDEKNAESYRANCKSYTEALDALDGDFRTLFAGCKSKTLIVGDVFPFRYFVMEYGLDYCAAFPGCAEGDVAPSLTQLAILSDKIRETKTGAVFYVEFSSKLTAERVAAETGATPTLLRSCHRLEREKFDAGVTYIDLMRENLETLKKVLS